MFTWLPNPRIILVFEKEEDSFACQVSASQLGVEPTGWH